jgi:hypothetical protein
MTDTDDIIRTNVDYLVTETGLNTNVPVGKIFAVLRQEQTTGQVIFHLSQGGIQKAVLCEKTKATSEKQRDKLRKVLFNGEHSIDTPP